MRKNKLRVAGVFFIGTFVLSLFTAKPALALAEDINVWWPVPDAYLEGTQPFKAIIDGLDVNSYDMYWKVDGGNLNYMQSNSTDYPHKEASVAMDGWNWNTSGTYKLEFVAKDHSGKNIGEKTFSIRAGKSVLKTPDPTPLPIPTEQQKPDPTTDPVSVEPSLKSTSELSVIENWWPVDNANINSVQPFKALLKDLDLGQYKMFWSVDNGTENLMTDNWTDYPHKEALVDLSNWNWHGAGPYKVTFTARDNYNKELAKKTIEINIDGQKAPNQDLAFSPEEIPKEIPKTEPAPKVSTVDPRLNPLSNLKFYIDPQNNAAKQAELWQNSRPEEALLLRKIAQEPQAKWFGDWNKDIKKDTDDYVSAANTKGETPVMIVYNIPGRDCGNYSAGGSDDKKTYLDWIDNFVAGIALRQAVVVLEPDALSLIDCLSSQKLADRYQLISETINKLKTSAKTMVYIDAGHSSWINADEMSKRLLKAGIALADGFALNVSNYYPTSDLISYGTTLSQKLGGKHFIIDTSRNGLGSNGEWCNPSNRALGNKPTTDTGNYLVDAYLWLKSPGESDGTCNGGPSAGVWWPEYALGLAKRASY